MDEHSQVPESNRSIDHYRRPLLEYVKDLPLNKSFEESEICLATKEKGMKVPKMFVRELLHGVAGIDQELLNFGNASGKICRRGPIETE